MPSKSSKKKQKQKQVVPESPPTQTPEPTPAAAPATKRRSIIATDLKVALKPAAKPADKPADRSCPITNYKTIAATPETACVPAAPETKATPKPKHEKRRSIVDADLKVGLKKPSEKKDRSDPLTNYAAKLQGLKPDAPAAAVPAPKVSDAEAKRARRRSVLDTDLKVELKKSEVKKDKSSPIDNFKAISATPESALVPNAPTARGVPKSGGKHSKRRSVTTHDLEGVALSKAAFKNDRSDPLLIAAAATIGATPEPPAAKVVVPYIDSKTAVAHARRRSVTPRDLKSVDLKTPTGVKDSSAPLANHANMVAGAKPPAPAVKAAAPTPDAKAARRRSVNTQDLKTAAPLKASKKDQKDRSDAIANFKAINATPDAACVPAAPAATPAKADGGKHTKRRSIVVTDLKEVGLKPAEVKNDRSSPLAVHAAKKISGRPDAPPAKEQAVITPETAATHAKRRSISVQDLKVGLAPAAFKNDRSDARLAHAVIASTPESALVPATPAIEAPKSKSARKKAAKKARAAREAIAAEDLKQVALKSVETNDRSSPATIYQAKIAGLTPAAPVAEAAPVPDARALNRAKRGSITTADIRSNRKLKKTEAKATADRSAPLENFKAISATSDAALVPATPAPKSEKPKEAKHAKRRSVTAHDLDAVALKKSSFQNDRSAPIINYAANIVGSTPDVPDVKVVVPYISSKAAVAHARRRSVNKHDLRSVELKKAAEVKDRSAPIDSFAKFSETKEAELVPTVPAPAGKPRMERHAKNRRSITVADLNIELEKTPTHAVKDRSDPLIIHAAKKKGATPEAPPAKQKAVPLTGKAAKNAKRRSITKHDLAKAELANPVFKSDRSDPLYVYGAISQTDDKECIPATPSKAVVPSPRPASKHAKRGSVTAQDLKISLKETKDTKDRSTPAAAYQAKLAGLTPEAPAATPAPTPDAKAVARAKRGSITNADLRSKKKLKKTEAKAQADRSAPLESFKAISATPDSVLVPSAPAAKETPKATDNKNNKRRSISTQDLKVDLAKTKFKADRSSPLLAYAANVVGATPDAPAASASPPVLSSKEEKSARRRSIQKHDLKVPLKSTHFKADRSGALLSWAAIASGAAETETGKTQ